NGLCRFDPEVFTMMDFRAEDQSVPTFFYQLPFSATEALVEVTQFSPHFRSFSGFEKQLHGYITDQLGIKIYAVEEEEMGCIPMTTADYPAKEGVRIYRLGTAGGDTKATTGYTFQNIQRHCAQVVSELLGEQMPRKAGRRYRFLDRLLLHIMREEPTRVSEIMERLFRSTRWPQLLRFLDEDTHLLEEIRMIARLPWSPFLRALSSPKPQTIDATLEDSVASERMAGSE
ncbi:MAG: lycopene cyclase family protein, partial [Bacteroidota bacterium]